MRKGFLASVAALVTGAGLAFAQTPTSDPASQRPTTLPDCGPVTLPQPAPAAPAPKSGTSRQAKPQIQTGRTDLNLPAPTAAVPGLAITADLAALAGCCSPCQA